MNPNRYSAMIEATFHASYRSGAEEVAFERDDFIRHAKELKIELPRNLGDIIYTQNKRFGDRLATSITKVGRFRRLLGSIGVPTLTFWASAV